MIAGFLILGALVLWLVSTVLLDRADREWDRKQVNG